MDAFVTRAPKRARVRTGPIPEAVEIFAGAGGMAWGVEDAGFKHVACIEWSKRCCETLRRNNFKGVIHSDASLIDYSRWTGVDLICGGPPCQPFSFGGAQLGPNDERDGWPIAIQAVRQARPRAFLFENVKGFLQPAFADYRQYIVGSFEALGYTVKTFLSDAADYGVPQRRRRVMVVGLRDSKWFPRPEQVTKWVTCREAFADLGPPNGENDHVGRDKCFPKPLPHHPASYLDAPSNTLTAGQHGGGGAQVLGLDDGTFRMFTPREQARLQSLPDTYKLPARWSQVVKEMGNACPAKLAQAYAEGILAALSQSPDSPSMRQPPSTPRWQSRESL